MGNASERIEREFARRCREWLAPAGQDLTDAEVVAAVGNTMFAASARLNVTAHEVFRPLTVPLRRFLRRIT